MVDCSTLCTQRMLSSLNLFFLTYTCVQSYSYDRTAASFFYFLFLLLSETVLLLLANAYTGVGYSLNTKLSSLGVSTCSDLQKLSLPLLQKQFGTKTGQMMYKCCRGTDDRTFRTGVERKSVSAEMNYGIRFSAVRFPLMSSVL